MPQRLREQSQNLDRDRSLHSHKISTTTSATKANVSCNSQRRLGGKQSRPSLNLRRNADASIQFPHLIVPINSTAPNKAYGTGYNSTASGTVSSIFNFDIPQSYAGKTCSLEFLFPTQDQLETSAYEFSGPGTFKVAISKG